MTQRSPNRLNALLAIAAAGAIAGASACSSIGLGDVEVTEAKSQREGFLGERLSPIEDDFDRIGEDDNSGGGIFGIGGSDGGAQLPVNKHLWRATLDTIAFLPLASTDPYGGVIVTDWGASPQAPNERVKVLAYITSAVLSPESLRVVVSRQTKDEGGAWVDAPVAPDTARALENAILTRARMLRSGEVEG